MRPGSRLKVAEEVEEEIGVVDIIDGPHEAWDWPTDGHTLL